MKSRGLRAVLVLLAVAALGGAGYFAYASEVQAQAARAAQAAFARDVGRLQAEIAEVRASLAGYVAAGQDAAVWARKVEQLLQDAQARTASLERNGITSDASQHIGTAEEAVAMLQQQEARIRDLLAEGRQNEASQVIFQDAAQLCTASSIALSEAVTLQAARTANAIGAGRWNEIYALAGAAGLAFLALLLLVPRAVVEAEAPPPRGSAPDAPNPVAAAGRGGHLDLGDEFRRSPNRPAPSAPPASQPAAPPVAPPRAAAPSAPAPAAPAPAAPTPPGLEAPQLDALARLCSDLVRVSDTEQLQRLLERTVSMLDASGLVIWLAAEGGSSLRPAFSFGYGPQAMARIKTLGRDEGNAVSDAFRETRVEVVAGAEGRSGALVTPLLSASGCVGVMALEMKGGGESRPATQALAAILAAQFATLMPSDEPA